MVDARDGALYRADARGAEMKRFVESIYWSAVILYCAAFAWFFWNVRIDPR